MIFRKKKEVLEPYSIEQCSSCNKTVKRKFKEGDYIFKTAGKMHFLWQWPNNDI